MKIPEGAQQLWEFTMTYNSGNSTVLWKSGAEEKK